MSNLEEDLLPQLLDTVAELEISKISDDENAAAGMENKERSMNAKSSDLSKNDNKINEMKPMNSSQPSSRLLDSKNEDEIVKMKQKDFAQPSSKLVVGKKEDEITEMKPANDPIIEVKSHERQQIKQVKTSEDWFREMVETGVKVDLGEHPQLRRALVRKDWKEVERFISENPDTLYAKFTESCGTLFHSMANINEDEAHRLLDEFLDMISPLDLEETDTSGGTPLTSAAIVGNTKAAKILVKYNKNLPNMRNRIGQCPIHCAARSGHRETVEYLLSVTGVEEEDSHEKYSNPFAGECGLKLLEILIEFNFLDIACNLLKQYPKLARDKDHHRRIILQKLAKKPKGFASGSRPGYWNRFIYHCVNPVQIEYIHSPQTQKTDFYAPENVKGDAENPIQRPDSSTKSIALRMATTFGALSQKLHIVFWNALVHLAPSIKDIHDTKLMHKQTVEIVRMMCAGIKWNFGKALEILKMPVLEAAKLGIYEIVNEIMKVYYSSLCFVDEDGNNLCMLAVLYRREKLFKLLRQMRGAKVILENSQDKSLNNILHLAGRLVPSSEVAGAALQMQREMQWFKVMNIT